MKTTVVNKYKHTPTNRDVYIGRGSMWGNNYTHLGHSRFSDVVLVATRAEAIRKYEEDFLKDPERLANVRALSGKNLVCYCKQGDEYVKSRRKSMKVCPACKTEKDLDEFYNSFTNRSLDNKGGWCKSCLKAYNNDKNKAYKGRLQKMVNSSRSRAKRDGREHLIEIEALITWAEANGYKEMYEAWVESNYDLGLTPTLDRVDASKGYTFDNIQLITYEDNVLKGHTENKPVKRVFQLDPETKEVLEIYDSITLAAKATKIQPTNIGRVCNGIRQTAGGFAWEFALSDKACHGDVLARYADMSKEAIDELVAKARA